MNQAEQSSTMDPLEADYPPAPWRLRGYGYQTIFPITMSAARQFAPPGARIVPVWPGKTLGCVYFASYKEGSTLIYHEIIIAAGLVWAGGRLGFAIPRLYVDNPHSYAGGHAIWGMPKQLAGFTIEEQGCAERIEVQQDGEVVMSLRFEKSHRAIPAWIPLPSFGVRGHTVMFFIARLKARVGFVRARVSVPANSPFAALQLDGPSLGLAYGDLDLYVPAARAVASTGSPTV